jgi:hypothetical protein
MSAGAHCLGGKPTLNGRFVHRGSLQWVESSRTRPLTGVGRAVRSRSGRSHRDCRKSGMRRIAATGRIGMGHAGFDGRGLVRT